MLHGPSWVCDPVRALLLLNEKTMTDKPTIKNVYSFPNGMTMVFDQFGKQMPEFQGKTEDVVPKIRDAGFVDQIEFREWR